MTLLLKIKNLICSNFKVNSKLVYSRYICSTTVQCSSNAERLRRFGASPDKKQDLLEKDRIPAGFELIYRAPLENYVTMSQNISTASAAVIAALASYTWAYNTNYLSMPIEIDIGGLVADPSEIWYFASGFIAINLLMRLFVSKYPLRIYKKESEYLAVYFSQIPFCSPTKHSFQRGDVSEVNNFINPWSDSMYHLGSRSSLLLLSYFRTPSEFNQMCGLK